MSDKAATKGPSANPMATEAQRIAHMDKLAQAKGIERTENENIKPTPGPLAKEREELPEGQSNEAASEESENGPTASGRVQALSQDNQPEMPKVEKPKAGNSRKPLSPPKLFFIEYTDKATGALTKSEQRPKKELAKKLDADGFTWIPQRRFYFNYKTEQIARVKNNHSKKTFSA